MYHLALIALVAAVIGLAWLSRRQQPQPTSVDPAVIEAFRKIYRQQIWLSLLVAPCLVWAFSAPNRGGSLHPVLVLVTGVLVVWVAVHTYRHWRCPKCGAYLGRNPLYNWQCPVCGTALREPRTP